MIKENKSNIVIIASIIDDNRSHSTCRRRLAPERAQTSYRARKTGETLSRVSGFASPSLEDAGQQRKAKVVENPSEESAMEKEEEEEMVEEAVAGGRTSATDDASTSGLVKQLFDASIRRRVSPFLFFRSVDHAREGSLDFRRKKKKKTEEKIGN